MWSCAKKGKNISQETRKMCIIRYDSHVCFWIPLDIYKSSFWSTFVCWYLLVLLLAAATTITTTKRLIAFNLRLLSLGAGAFLKLGDGARDKLYGAMEGLLERRGQERTTLNY